MEREQIVAVLNEWMRRYIEEPETFEAEFETVIEFLEDEAEGREPSYGESCAAYMEKILEDLTTTGDDR